MFDDTNKKQDNNSNPVGNNQNMGGASNSPVPPTPPTTPQPNILTPNKQQKENGVEDMYAGINDREVSNRANPSQDPQTQTPPVSPQDLNKDAYSSSGGNKFLILGISVIGFLLVAAFGYYVFASFFQTDDYSDNMINIENGENVDENMDQTMNDDVKEESGTTTEEDTLDDANQDNDGDGLSNREELVLGTDINSVDSDGDGLFDKEEVQVYNTFPLDPDSDGDGISDGEEVKAGYDPMGEGKLFDSVKKEDGYDDAQEETPTVVDADKDGLSDERESELGTNKSKIDSDEDGLNDYEEVEEYKTDPLVSDTDGDGYTDGEEVNNGYNPNGEGLLN